MKKLLSYLTILAAVGLFFTACKENSTSDFGVMPLKTGTSGGSSAHPAIVYSIQASSSPSGKAQIAVMDTDGANQTAVYTAATTSESATSPSWSSGGSVAWAKSANGLSTAPSSIMACDVSTNSKGKPVSSNLRTIASLESGSQCTFTNTTWSTNSSTAKIAFVLENWTTGNTYLCTVPAAGGAWDTLASAAQAVGSFGAICWSTDDSKIAVCVYGNSSYNGQANHHKIVIFDASIGTALDSIDMGAHAPYGTGITLRSGDNASIKWSRAGKNTLAFAGSSNLYYVDPSTGSTPTTNNVSVNGGGVAWSPNNSVIMISNVIASGREVQKLPPNTANISTIIQASTTANIGDWHQ